MKVILYLIILVIFLNGSNVYSKVAIPKENDKKIAEINYDNLIFTDDYSDIIDFKILKIKYKNIGYKSFVIPKSKVQNLEIKYIEYNNGSLIPNKEIKLPLIPYEEIKLPLILDNGEVYKARFDANSDIIQTKIVTTKGNFIINK